MRHIRDWQQNALAVQQHNNNNNMYNIIQYMFIYIIVEELIDIDVSMHDQYLINYRQS